LERLLAWSHHHLSETGQYLLLKGSDWEEEVKAAQQSGWKFTYATTPSITDPSGVILTIKEVTHD
jgi:16S rRNA G527 N7-methylase RsmG